MRVYSWVDLQPGPVSAAPTQAAYLLGQLHTLAIADDRTVDPWFSEPLPPERWDQLTMAAIDANAPWAALMAERVVDLVATNELVLAGPAGPLDNLPSRLQPTERAARDRRRRSRSVDWENCGPAVAECELAGALAEFEVPPREVRHFLAAYEAGGGTRVRLRPTSFAGVLAVQQHLIEHYAIQALDDKLSIDERKRKAFWLDDILTHLFTVERIQLWVASDH